MKNKISMFKEYIKETEIDEKELAMTAMRNYLENKMNMNIVSFVNLGDEHSYRDEYEIVTNLKDGNAETEYLFQVKHYDIDDFLPRENYLVLKKIRGKEGVLEISKDFYLKGSRADENHKDPLFNTSLSDLISGKVKDKELSFVVDLIKKKFIGEFGFKYTEESPGNINTFIIEFDNARIFTGFSNTLQVDFKKDNINSMQIYYREVEKKEVVQQIEELYEFMKGYSSDNIVLYSEHNISHLMKSLSVLKTYIGYNSTLLVKQLRSMNNENVEVIQLANTFIIGEYSSFHQTEMSINYNLKSNEFVLNANYLFNEIQVECKSIDELIDRVLEIRNSLIQ